MNTLLRAAMARAQRDNKVTICHYLWMGNHAHIILIPQCPQSCVNFYQELQKKITDSVKRLLGKKRLSLWEGDPVLAQILDPQKAIDRVAYLYANPARANLVDSIKKYPGASSWEQFSGQTTPSSKLPWIRLTKIQKLRSLYITQQEEDNLVSLMSSNAPEYHPLVTNPAALFEAFGIFGNMNEAILHRLKVREEEARVLRHNLGKSVPSNIQLLSQKIFAYHTPKRRPGDRRIFVLSSIKEQRISFIKAFKEFCAHCTYCYQLMVKGAPDIPWPISAFRPYSLVIK